MTLSLTPVFSVERPPQANGTLPSFVAGVQIAHNGLKAPYNGAQAADTSLRPLSLQVSGVGRRLEANSGGPTKCNWRAAQFEQSDLCDRMGRVHQSLSPSSSVKEWGDRQYGSCRHGRRHWSRHCGLL